MSETEDLAATWDRRSVPHAATAVLQRIEGFSATPYDDNGAQAGGTWTIGYGTTRDAKGRPISPLTPPVTEAEAESLLLRDMAGAAQDVARLVRPPLSLCQAAALISWTYNLGGDALAGSTLLKRLNAGDLAAVPGEMRKWIKQGDKPLLGLLRRRWAEAAIFRGLPPAKACARGWAEIDSLDDWPAF
ncbi:lysozyme [Paracraurococcus ruber]|uniref:Lysozyme n=1 Tax=Paracraurococcus ruber TaxID=77675 RepID=A0ABS1CXN9_9PROT|nr:lysozyme [Paracraurococcus ruber]MBK1659306.1 hypothetical protein [Paracraurococcus ruber]TDG32860.1 lysozyme [Paracraurococcus ruber]